MLIAHIILLSLIQGITEFLPISSSAHLVLLPILTTFEDQGIYADMAAHAGTLVAVVAYFYKDTYQLLIGFKDLLSRRIATDAAQLFLNVAIATFPVLIAALLFKDLIAGMARNAHVLAITSILFGVLLWLSDKYGAKIYATIKLMKWQHALFFGLSQALAMVPGTSRSGITMTMGRALGYNRKAAAKFSMLMSIPVLIMVGLYTFLRTAEVDDTIISLPDLGLIALFSGLFGLFSIHILMTWVNKIGFAPFAIYRVLLGVFLLLFF